MRKLDLSLIIVLGFLGIFLFNGCGKLPTERRIYSDTVSLNSRDQKSNQKIKFASTIPPSDQKIISEDFDFLAALQIEDKSAGQLVSLMKINTASPHILVNWLNERFRYLVPQDLRGVYGTLDHRTGETSVFVSEARQEVSPNTFQPTVVAMNIGALIYMVAKKGNLVYRIGIPGHGEVMLSSPRVGIIQEGNGLFKDFIGEGPPDDVPHKLFRLGTFFHEARHSDGSGPSLCFSHSICPPGHDYADHAACDSNSNGPYTIDAAFVLAFLNTCVKCSVKTKSILESMIAESFNRMISTDFWDDAPEGYVEQKITYANRNSLL